MELCADWKLLLWLRLEQCPGDGRLVRAPISDTESLLAFKVILQIVSFKSKYFQIIFFLESSSVFERSIFESVFESVFVHILYIV